MAHRRRRFAERRRACGYSQEAFAEAIRVDRTTVVRWECGETEPQPWHRPKIARVLEVSLDELHGLLAEGINAAGDAQAPATLATIRRGVTGQEVGETNRRQALTTALGLTSATVVGSSLGSAPERSSVDAADQLLMTVTAMYRRLECSRASTLLVEPVVGCVSLVRSIIDSGELAGGRMYAVLSETAGLAAWLHVDLNDGPGARRYYRLAVESAERSGHDLLPSYMEASLGLFAADSGDIAYGCDLLRRARHRLPRRAPQLAHVWLDAVQATVLAHRRDQEALKLLGRSEKRLGAISEGEPAWPWIFRFDHAKHAAYRAVCAVRLGLTAEARAALAEASTAVQAPKQHAVLQVEHARVLWTDGEVEASCALASAALDTAYALGSERVHQAVRRLRATMGNRASRLTDELDWRLASVYREPA